MGHHCSGSLDDIWVRTVGGHWIRSGLHPGGSVSEIRISTTTELWWVSGQLTWESLNVSVLWPWQGTTYVGKFECVCAFPWQLTTYMGKFERVCVFPLHGGCFLRPFRLCHGRPFVVVVFIWKAAKIHSNAAKMHTITQ